MGEGCVSTPSSVQCQRVGVEYAHTCTCIYAHTNKNEMIKETNKYVKFMLKLSVFIEPRRGQKRRWTDQENDVLRHHFKIFIENKK